MWSTADLLWSPAERARRSLIDPRVFTLRPKTMKAYLVAHGWKPHTTGSYMVRDDMVCDDKQPILVLAPPHNKFGDLKQRTIELLQQLSDLERRPALDILGDMLALQAGDPAPPANGNGSHAPKKRPARKSG